MRRRELITLFGGAIASWPLAARGQQSDHMRRIGVLMGWEESDPATQALVATFRAALAKLGWAEDSNLRIELRWGNGNEARIETFAKELVNLRPDTILGQTTPVIRAFTRETRTVPIVLCKCPIRSAGASPRASGVRVATSPALRQTIPRRAVNGWRY
jgi:putative ABC transport system substrate-binding protein